MHNFRCNMCGGILRVYPPDANGICWVDPCVTCLDGEEGVGETETRRVGLEKALAESHASGCSARIGIDPKLI